MSAVGADAPQATRVVIESGWGGLNPEMPFRTHIVIERREDTYQLSGGHSKHHLGTQKTRWVAYEEVEGDSVCVVLDVLHGRVWERLCDG